MPVFHIFITGGKKYLFDANANEFININDNMYLDLKTYISSGYKEKSETVDSLLKQGYLKDRPNFEMIHPMDSTLEYALERNIGTAALQVTQGCNLRCKYCSYSGEYDNRVHGNKRMSKEIAFSAIDFVLNHSIDRDEIHLGFYGGEPLLEFELIKDCVEYAKRKCAGKKISFNMTSNTTLINDDIIDFLYNNKFSLTISLDGDRQAHDKNRRFASNGLGSFDTVIRNIKRILELHPDYIELIHINSVIDPTTDFDSTNRFFTDNSIIKDLHIQANLISEYYRKGEVETDDRYREKYSYEVFKLYLEKMGRVPKGKVSKLVLGSFKNIMDIHEAAKVSSTSVKRDHPSGPCVPGIQRLFIDVEGNLYPCERVSEVSKVVRIGNIFTGFDVEQARRILNIGKLTEKECRNCWAFRFCSSCVVQADDLDKLSADKKIANCGMIRGHVDSMMKDYCVLKDLGFDFENEKIF